FSATPAAPPTHPTRRLLRRCPRPRMRSGSGMLSPITRRETQPPKYRPATRRWHARLIFFDIQKAPTTSLSRAKTCTNVSTLSLQYQNHQNGLLGVTDKGLYMVIRSFMLIAGLRV